MQQRKTLWVVIPVEVDALVHAKVHVSMAVVVVAKAHAQHLAIIPVLAVAMVNNASF